MNLIFNERQFSLKPASTSKLLFPSSSVFTMLSASLDLTLSQEVAWVLNTCTLAPQMEKIVKEIKPEYIDGAIAIEVRDYRHDRDADPEPYKGTPRVTRLTLRPSYATLIADIDEGQDFAGVGPDDRLKVPAPVTHQILILFSTLGRGDFGGPHEPPESRPLPRCSSQGDRGSL